MAEPSAGIDYKKFPILMVDDEKGDLKAFSNEFSEYFTILTAESAEEGLKLIEENPNIVLVLADQRMPVKTGSQMLGELRKNHPFITRILITAYADITAAIDAINTGEIFKYVSKPYQFEELKEILIAGIERYYRLTEAEKARQLEIDTLRRVISEESLSALNTLAFGFSHHINNKLTGAYSFLQLLPEKIKELVEKVSVDKEYWEDFRKLAQENIEVVRSLLTELLTYASSTEYKFKKVDLLNLILSKKELFQRLGKDKELEFLYKLPEALPPVTADPLKIEHALENIVLNAIQAVSSRGVVKIFASEMEGPHAAINITVIDNGIGIMPDNLKNIFQPFFTTKGPQAKGLGLTISDFIVRQHGGEIDVRSKPGEGTSVTIQLPL